MNIPLLEKSVDALLTRRSDSPTIRDFSTSRQIELFETLKQLRFSGQLILSSLQGQTWVMHLYKGLIVYGTGGEHPVKRWERNLSLYAPQALAASSAPDSALVVATEEGSSVCWQYQLLGSWVEQQKISREQEAKVIWSMIVEILFDITQAGQVTYELKPSSLSLKKRVLIDPAQAVGEASRLWQAWQEAKIADFSPNSVPIIKRSAELQQTVPASTFQALSQLLNGQQTLRDMAVQMKRDVVNVGCSLLPYIQSGLVEFTQLPDRASPLFTATADPDVHSPLIACVDDNPWISQIMDKVLTSAHYRFIGLNDSLRAIGVLLALKPDLIFLDLMMPNANGYELCSKLRQLPVFRNTPIVILTGSDGVIDRVKAKMVGSSSFLSKPVNAKKVLEVVQKHLKYDMVTSEV
jgi:two-component system, chemotaxis family, response regulator PixG